MEVVPNVLLGFWLLLKNTSFNMPSQQLNKTAVGVTKAAVDRVFTALSTLLVQVTRTNMVLCILEKVRQGYTQDVLVKKPKCFGAKVLNTIANMDQGYTWASELIPHPDEDGIPRVILRRVPAPTSPTGSPSGSSGDLATSSLLGDTMDQGYMWIKELIPHPDEGGMPRVILRRVPAPTSPSGSSSGSSTGDSDTSSLLGDTMDQGHTWTSELIPHPDEGGIPPCDLEVSPSDPNPAPGKPLEASPPNGPVTPGKIKSLPGSPKPRWVQNMFRLMNQVGSIRRKRTAKPEGESAVYCSTLHQ
ncbi:hypothetical protein ABVT39_007297 [Epinephelus coioides]